jgi:uracil-DNA glycosylase
MMSLTYIPEPQEEDEEGPQCPHPACRECGLWKGVRSWNIEPEFDSRVLINGEPVTGQEPWVLVVSQAPSVLDDKQSGNFQDLDVGGFLRSFLDVLESRWVLTTGVRCYPGKGKDGKNTIPSDRQIQACSVGWLSQLIVQVRPKVILCLGVMAMQAVLGPSAPKTLHGAGKDPLFFELGDVVCSVLVVQHPVNHVMGRADLLDAYIRTFTLIDNLAHDRSPRPLDFPRTLVEDDRTFELVLREVWDQSPIILDIEDLQYLDAKTGCAPDVANAATANHPGSELICLGFGWYTEEWEIHTAVVFDKPGPLYRYDLWELLLTDRIIVAHNSHYEIQNLYFYSKKRDNGTIGFQPLDLLKLCRKTPEGLPWIDCTLQFNYLQDIGKGNNSLKVQSEIRYQAPPWEHPIKVLLDSQAKMLEEARKGFNSSIRELRKHILTLSKPLANSQQEEVRLANLRAAQDQLQELEYKLKTLPTRVNYRTVERADRGAMFVYNAHDLYFTAKLYLDELRELQIVYQQSPSIAIAIQAHRRTLYVLCQIERNGMPVNRDRLQRYEDLLSSRELELKSALLGSALVRECLVEAGSVSKTVTLVFEAWAVAEEGNYGPAVEEHNRPLTPLELEDVHEALGGNKKKFAQALLAREPLREMCPKTPTGQASIRDDILDVYCGGEPDAPEDLRPMTYAPWEEKTELQRIWWCMRALRRIQKLQGTYCAQLRLFMGPDDHVRPEFVMAKSEKIYFSGSGTDEASGGGTTTGRLTASRPPVQTWDSDDAFRCCLQAPNGILRETEEEFCYHDGDRWVFPGKALA